MQVISRRICRMLHKNKMEWDDDHIVDQEKKTKHLTK